MYQIKINNYSGIITDDLSLNIDGFYEFINKVDKIIYINNRGFVLDYNNKRYFFNFKKEEIIHFENKQYSLLPYTHQRLVRIYHIKNDIIETNAEKQEYLEILDNNKPLLKKIILNNYKKMLIKFIQEKDLIKILNICYLIKEIFYSIKEFEKEINNWEEKKQTIKKLDVSEFSFQLKIDANEEIILDKMININYLLRRECIINKDILINEFNNIILFYQDNKDNKLIMQIVLKKLNELERKIEYYKGINETEDKIVNIFNVKKLVKEKKTI